MNNESGDNREHNHSTIVHLTHLKNYTWLSIPGMTLSTSTVIAMIPPFSVDHTIDHSYTVMYSVPRAVDKILSLVVLLYLSYRQLLGV